MKYCFCFYLFRYLISRGYGQPQDKDSGGSDDDMSDEGTDDTLPSTLRERMDGPGHRLEFLIGDKVLPYDMTVYQVTYFLFKLHRDDCVQADFLSGEKQDKVRDNDIYKPQVYVLVVIFLTFEFAFPGCAAIRWCSCKHL